MLGLILSWSLDFIYLLSLDHIWNLIYDVQNNLSKIVCESDLQGVMKGMLSMAVNLQQKLGSTPSHRNPKPNAQPKKIMPWYLIHISCLG